MHCRYSACIFSTVLAFQNKVHIQIAALGAAACEEFSRVVDDHGVVDAARHSGDHLRRRCGCLGVCCL